MQNHGEAHPGRLSHVCLYFYWSWSSEQLIDKYERIRAFASRANVFHAHRDQLVLRDVPTERRWADLSAGLLFEQLQDWLL